MESGKNKTENPADPDRSVLIMEEPGNPCPRAYHLLSHMDLLEGSPEHVPDMRSLISRIESDSVPELLVVPELFTLNKKSDIFQEILSVSPFMPMLVVPCLEIRSGTVISGRELSCSNEQCSVIRQDTCSGDSTINGIHISEETFKETENIRLNLACRLITDLEGRLDTVIDSMHSIAESLEEEKEISALKTRFLSIFAHEFRTPMTAIQSASDILRSYDDRLTSEMRQERLDRIQKSIRLMSALLDDALNLSRTDSINAKPDLEIIDLPAMAKDLISQIQLNRSYAHQICFEWDGSVDTVLTDENYLRHIFANLLSNAVKYSEPGKSVYILARCNDEGLRLTVKDEGRGIPPEEKDKIFTPFYRSSEVAMIPGTGLGLSIVQKFVQRLQGEIQVESEAGKGSTFTVFLPKLNQEG